MKKKLLLPLLAITSIILVGCSAANSGDSSLLSIEDSGRIVATNGMSYDWEEIDIEGGTVDHKFAFKNDGDEDLILKGAVTSCMCTTATLELPNGEFSPAFGMHQNGQWAYAIKPGEEFNMDVVFDPMAHGPDATGPIQRSVYLVTSSSPNGEYAKADPKSEDVVTEVKLSGNVLKSAAFQQLQLKNAETEDKISTFQNLSIEDFDSMLANKDFFLLDVHIPEQKHIENTDAFIPYNEIDQHLSQLPQDKSEKIVVYCRSGSMSVEASKKLNELGYENVFNLVGGRNAYVDYIE